ncbi:hypothetical protein [Pedobacter sp. ASV12]|uniref:hypothetical protein n=1 Tax=Pedobacter sp. ASV12 TaxID=2795120 RepID=UPI001E4DF3BB|nr:hypothetical protein [Pedobacter sp. ASV12]
METNKMAERPRRKLKLFKWIAAILLFVVLGLASASWYLSIKLKPIIGKELRALVRTSTHGLYSLDFANIHTNFITGTATIGEVRITPDTTVFKQLIAAQKAPNNLYYIRLKKLSVKRFKPWSIYFDKVVDVKLLLFDKPEVTMVNRHFDFNDNLPPRPRKSPYEYIAKLFKSLRVEVVDFKNMKLKYVDNNGPVPEIDSLANMNVTLKDWLIDPTSAQDTSRLYLLKDIDINISDYTYATPDSMYHLNVHQLDFNAKSGKLSLKHFGAVPRYSEGAFARVAGYAKSRYHIQLDNLVLNGIDLPAFIQKKALYANDMHIAEGNVSVFRNSTFPKLEKVRTGRFPQQLLQKLDLPISIKKVSLGNINISYAEFSRRSLQKGKITFEKTSGTLSNMTNMPKVKAVQPIMQADLQSYIMGQGKLEISFKFDLNSPIGAFSYKGNISDMDGRKLNQVSKALGLMQINKGTIKQFAFDIAANEQEAKGQVKFRFSDLSLTLLKKEEGEEWLKRKALLSILANALVIRSDNPDSTGKFIIAPVQFERKPTSSFFNFIWKTLFQGVKYSIGVTPQKEAEIRAKIASFEQMKGDREERRKRRQERREQREREEANR